MSEDDIISQRVLISELHYKRLAKLTSDVVNLTNPTKQQLDSLRESIVFEVYSYESMLQKLQLQLSANDSEIRHYQNEMLLSQQKIQRLSARTQALQSKLSQEQLQRERNEEYSQIVSDFSKPRKFTYPQDEGEPFLALLNSSRRDFENENENLEQEIHELESVQAMYQEVWDKRKAKFQEYVTALAPFKQELE